MFLSWIWLIDGLIMGADISLFFAFAAVYYQVIKTGAATGLSLQTLSIVVFTRIVHLFSHPMDLHFEPTMIPYWTYTIFDILNSSFGAFLLYYIFARLLSTYEVNLDNFGEGFSPITIGDHSTVLSRIISRVAVSLTFSSGLGLIWWFFRRSRQAFAASFFTCFYEVLGAVALFPQLWMFQKTRVASPQLANFVAMIALNRLCTLTFWIVYPWIFQWRYPDNRGIQMASEVLNLVIISDFLYYYLKAKYRGESSVRIPNRDIDEV